MAAATRSASGSCSTNGASVREPAPARQDALLGYTAVGDTAALHEVIDARVFDSAQVTTICSIPLPPRRCRRVIRRKTTGGCSTPQRPPASAWWAFVCWPVAHFPARASAIPSPAHRQSDRLGRQIRRRSCACAAAQAAGRRRICRKSVRSRHPLRHVPPAMGTILVGMASPQQFEHALAAVRQGPLSQAALDRVATQQQGFAGEAR